VSGLRRRRLPLAATVPLVVALLMAAVGTVASVSVLDRLQANQEVEMRRMAEAFGGSLAAALANAVAQHDVWSTFDLIDRALSGNRQLSPSLVLAIDDAGRVLASSQPHQHPVGSLPPEEFGQRGAVARVAVDNAGGLLRSLVPVAQEGRPVGALAVAFDISPFVAERREVLMTLIAVNAGLTILFAGLGYAIVRRMVAPAAAFVAGIGRSTGGVLDPVPEAEVARAAPEYRDLYRRYNAVVATARDRERLAEQLAREENAAVIGRLAASMAHEVNNPLGGLVNTVDTLERHGSRDEVRAESIAILRRGLAGIRDVVGAMLVSWRQDDGTGWLTPDGIDDLRTLVGPQARRKALRLEWDNGLGAPVAVAAGAVRQITLNLLLNACAAAPMGGTVTLRCARTEEGLALTVSDDGRGLPAPWQAFLADRSTAPPPASAGALGLWTVRELVVRHGGTAATRRPPAGGTEIEVRLPFASGESRHVAA
jgi:signal transduction histidine kinase